MIPVIVNNPMPEAYKNELRHHTSTRKVLFLPCPETWTPDNIEEYGKAVEEYLGAYDIQVAIASGSFAPTLLDLPLKQ